MNKSKGNPWTILDLFIIPVGNTPLDASAHNWDVWRVWERQLQMQSPMLPDHSFDDAERLGWGFCCLEEMTKSVVSLRKLHETASIKTSQFGMAGIWKGLIEFKNGVGQFL